MSFREEAEQLIKVLYRHRELIVDAYLNHNDELIPTPENEKAIASLVKNRLAYLLDDPPITRLSTSVTELMESGLRYSRRRGISADTARRLQELKDLVDSYRLANHKCAFEDANQLMRKIEDATYQLIEQITSSTRVFFQYINDGFGYYSTLEVRIKENERVIKQASRLNDDLLLFDMMMLQELAGHDASLNKLFLGPLLTAVSKSGTNLVDAIHRLKKMLFKLREQQGRAELVKVLTQHYQKYPEYRPSCVDALAEFPSTLNVAPPLSVRVIPDCYSIASSDLLIELLEGVRKVSVPDEEREETEQALLEDENDSPIELVMSPLESSVYELYKRVVSSGEPTSAREHYSLTPEGTSMDLWLFIASARYECLTALEKKSISIRYEGDYHPHFDGNQKITDVILEYAP